MGFHRGVTINLTWFVSPASIHQRKRCIQQNESEESHLFKRQKLFWGLYNFWWSFWSRQCVSSLTKQLPRRNVLPDIPGAVVETAILHSARAISKLLWNNCALFIRCLLGNNTTMSEFGLNYPKIKLKYWCLSISFFAPLSVILSQEQCTLYFFNRQLLYQ